MDRYLSKKDTIEIKAVAVLIMIMHHLWGDPSRIAGEGLKCLLSTGNSSLIQFIGSIGNICVSIFFFLGGYGLYVGSYGKKVDVVSRIKKLYGCYWKVFFVFIPLAFCFFSNQGIYCEDASICTRYDSFSFGTFVLSILGLSSKYNGEWWFIFSYLMAIISFPLIRSVVNRCSTSKSIMLFILTSIMVGYILPAISNLDIFSNLKNSFIYDSFICQSYPGITSFWMGIIFAAKNGFGRLEELLTENKCYNKFFAYMTCIAIIILRKFGPGAEMDFVYVPFFIIALKIIIGKHTNIKKVLEKIGKQSTYMWLIHTFYCYYFYGVVRIIVSVKWAVPALLLLIILTYFSAVIVNVFWKSIFGLMTKIDRVIIHPKEKIN